jgi:hypothetical protein
MDSRTLIAIAIAITFIASYGIVYAVHANKRTFTLVIDNNLYEMTPSVLDSTIATTIFKLDSIEPVDFEISFNRGATWIKHKMGPDRINIGSGAAYMTVTNGILSIMHADVEAPISDYTRIPPQIKVRWFISKNSGLYNSSWFNCIDDETTNVFTWEKASDDVEYKVNVDFVFQESK